MEMLILLVLAGLAVVAISCSRKMWRWNQAYEELGRRYVGKDFAIGQRYGLLFWNPSLVFDYGRSMCSLRHPKRFLAAVRKCSGKHHQTVFAMTWPGERIRLEVATHDSQTARWGISSMKDVQVGVSEFDSRLSVQSNRSDVAQRMLSSGVRWKLMQLSELAECGMVVLLDKNRLSVTIPKYLKTYRQLDDLVQHSLSLFDQLLLTEAQGIAFVQEDEASIVAAATCPVCSEDVQTDWVVCSRCKTPHCRDCWEYNGKCATFACQESRFVLAGHAAPAHSANS